jgi:head-tail adaptor
MRRSNAGDFRHRMAIEVNQNTGSGAAKDQTFSQPLDNWQPLMNGNTAVVRYCSIEPLSGREVFVAGEVQADVSHRIRMRFTPGLTGAGGLGPRARGIYGGRTFNFLSVIDLDEAHEELEILAVEVQTS